MMSNKNPRTGKGARVGVSSRADAHGLIKNRPVLQSNPAMRQRLSILRFVEARHV